jgi:hypothetical protein
MQTATPECMRIVHGRMWVRGPHVLQSRVPSAFVSQSHHHACSTTAPRTSVSMHTHPYHTRLSLHAPARPMHRATLECMRIVHGRMWVRGPHGLQSRVPSAFVAQSHHHACSTTAPRISVNMHTHTYHTRLFLHASARPDGQKGFARIHDSHRGVGIKMCRRESCR